MDIHKSIYWHMRQKGIKFPKYWPRNKNPETSQTSWSHKDLLRPPPPSSATNQMSAIFDFSSLLTVILLIICTCAYLREMRPTIFDGGKVSEAEHLTWACHGCIVRKRGLPFLWLVSVSDFRARWNKTEANGGDWVLLEDEPNRRTIKPLCWCELCYHGYSLAVF